MAGGLCVSGKITFNFILCEISCDEYYGSTFVMLFVLM